ncbi:septum formation initiator family protein [Streptomyces sp. NPDC091289]|uniref:FtsB family cell division protein n=1 Tax=Streptomyces sp. NPDC091289 TaxID=3365989 RepID=UPI00381F85BE
MSKPAAPLKGRAARLARLMPSTGPSSAARTPFVLLVVLLLGGGLITLLLLNSALNEGSFRLSELKRDTTELTDEQQALQRDVDSRSQPDALERRARELGMVPGGSPAFLNPDGTVRGAPTEATAPPSPSPSPTPSPSAAADATPDPDAPEASAGAAGSASPSGSVPATEPDPATAPGAENSPPPTSPGR